MKLVVPTIFTIQNEQIYLDYSCGCDFSSDGCGCDYDIFDPTPNDCGCDD